MKHVMVLLLLALPVQGGAAVVINEFVTETSSDWVELKATEHDDRLDISDFYVTMYYGTNEALAQGPVTLSGEDNPATPWDDRFVVIHLSDSSGVDETDEAGDLNGNGIRDIYCNNYSSSLWNTDGVVSLDSDDDPGNGGILDFVAYTNRDGDFNSTMEGYVEKAAGYGQWPQGDCLETSVFTGDDGLLSHQSVSRISSFDTNSRDDFKVTIYQTPGRDNIAATSRKVPALVSVVSKRKTAVAWNQGARIECMVREVCDLRFSVYAITGVRVHEAGLMRNCRPGFYTFHWKPSRHRELRTGLFLGVIEATGSSGRHIRKTVYLVLHRKGQ